MNIRGSLIAFGVALAASGCSTSSPDPLGTPTPEPASIVMMRSEHPAVLKCAPHLEAVEIALGKQQNTPFTASLTQKVTPHSYKPGVEGQVSVTLTLTTPSKRAVVTAIVHTTGSSDKEFVLKVAPGGTVTQELLTSGYAASQQYPDNFPIFSITLCTRVVG